MATASNLTGTLRRSLLIKVISKPAPSKEDVNSVIELTASKVVESLQAQSMTLYLVEAGEIAFKHIYYSPTLWGQDKDKEIQFKETTRKLLALKLPAGTGNVGKVIQTGEPLFFSGKGPDAASLKKMDVGFEVNSMLTVPLKTNIVIGAIQVLNKEPSAGTGGLFTPKDLSVLMEVAEYSSTLIQRMLDPKFQLTPEDTAKFIAKFTELPLVSKIEDVEFDEKLVEITGDAIIRRECIFPYKKTGATSCSVLMTNPLDYAKRESFSQATELSIDEVKVIPANLLDALLKKAFGEKSGAAKPGADAAAEVDIDEVKDLIAGAYTEGGTSEVKATDLESEDSAPIIQLTNRIIEDAYVSGASDIHIEPMEKDLVVRYRVDGVCAEKMRLPKQVTHALVARLKIMCNLDISERRLPQDGRIVFKKYTKKNIDIDLRVATGPMNHGEKVVMRILDKQKSTLPLPMLGFSDENLAKYRECVRQPYGMILHCGPTGSGKSMTLYAALAEINTPDVNIQTAEDPIEYTLPGLNQMQMNKQIGLTFERALRCYLRMDPDIILVGEIRDKETAQIACEAALTGHLLVSTLHTNDAPSTVARMGEMGIEPFNISAALVCVCAQRLLRRVCKNCKVKYVPEGREAEIIMKALDLKQAPEIFKAAPGGCHVCGGTGYKGRVGIHELMVNNEELVEAINAEVEVADLKRVAMKTGMKTLHQDSMLKVKMGLTTMEDALSNVPADMISEEGAEPKAKKAHAH
jgi:type II secretory ATPase GspE/PulE/Tfp pilus assembly ATPase PilB-like protein